MSKSTQENLSKSADQIEEESRKIMRVLEIAKQQQRSFMEDSWDARIPLECSTPKMLSCIGREIQQEIRRNSISLATGIKRKSSPQAEQGTMRKQKFNSSGNLTSEINMEKISKEGKKETTDDDNKVSKENEQESTNDDKKINDEEETTTKNDDGSMKRSNHEGGSYLIKI